MSRPGILRNEMGGRLFTLSLNNKGPLTVENSVRIVDHLLPVVQRHIDAALARADKAERALETLGKERNTWARQLADAHDERDTARTQLDRLRNQRDENQHTIYRIEALLYDWEQLGRAAGVHGRQLRRALDGPDGGQEPA